MSAEILREDPCEKQQTGWNAFSERYGSFEQEFTLLPVQTVSALLKAEKILQELMKVGIHTHERFEEAMLAAQTIEEDV